MRVTVNDMMRRQAKLLSQAPATMRMASRAPGGSADLDCPHLVATAQSCVLMTVHWLTQLLTEGTPQPLIVRCKRRLHNLRLTFSRYPGPRHNGRHFRFNQRSAQLDSQQQPVEQCLPTKQHQELTQLQCDRTSIPNAKEHAIDERSR